MAAETAPGQASPLEIFYSYAHADEALRQELLKHLALLQRQGYIISWHDRLITAGSDWAHEIDSHLESADIILLLISADFLASNYCYGIEMQRALEREQAGEARVIPILVRSCDWESSPFGRLQALPSGALPISKWPDPDDAFLNVVRGLRSVIADMTGSGDSSPSIAPSQPTSRIANIPFNPLFTGREDILQRLHEALRKDRTAALTQPPQAISGLGGVGKTQTAIEYAYRHRDEYRYIFWVRAETQQELASDYTTIADLLNLPASRQPNQDQKVAAVKRWLQANTGWLLILDNADNLQQAQPFLPTGSHGHIILTTRAQALGKLAQRVEIERMEPDEGTLFLLRRARILAEDAPLAQVSPSARTQALAIVQEVDGLPLALDQAGAYIEETRCGLDGYLRLYRAQRASLLKRRSRTPNPDYRETVATTWTLAFQKVEAASPPPPTSCASAPSSPPTPSPKKLLPKAHPTSAPPSNPSATHSHSTTPSPN